MMETAKMGSGMESDHVCEVWYDGRKIGSATSGEMMTAMIEAEKQRIRREEEERAWNAQAWGHDWDPYCRRCRRCQMWAQVFEDQRPKQMCQGLASP